MSRDEAPHGLDLLTGIRRTLARSIHELADILPGTPGLRLRGCLVPVIITALAAFMAAPLFVHPEYLGVEDWDQNLFKLAAPRITILHHGQVPLWNPWEAGGFPLLAHPESRFLFPSFILPLLFGPVLGVKLEIVLHYGIGLWGVYSLCRHLHLRLVAALVGACVYMLSGMYALSIASGMSVFLSGAFIPWSLLWFLRATRRPLLAVAAGSMLALMFLDGGVVFTVLTVLLLCVYSAASLLLRRAEPRHVVQALTTTIASAFALAAIKALPAMQLMFRVSRSVDDYSGYSVASFLRALVDRHQNLGAPLPQGMGFWEGTSWGIDENGMYIGALGLMLILVGLVTSAREAAPLAVTSAIFLWLAFGNRAPIDLWAALHSIPVFTSMRVAQRFRFVAMLGAAVFAGFGADSSARWLALVLQRGVRSVTIARLSCAILLVLAVDLVTVNSRCLAEAFPIARVPGLRAGPFRQVSGLGKYDTDGHLSPAIQASPRTAWSSMYPAILANLGTLDTAGPMADVFEPAACSSTSESYRGEAYLEETHGSVSIEFFSPNRLRLHVQAAAPSTLVVNQNYDPGWNSATGPVVATRGLISIPVPAGDHTVELQYRPLSVVLGAAVSGCSLLALLMFGALRLARASRSTTT